MKTLRNMTVALLATVTLASCGGSKANTSVDPQGPTVLVVDNQNFLDMTIYAYEGARRVRLGIAAGLSETRLTIPASMVRTTTSMRFQADPIGASRTPFSDEIQVSPGDEIKLRIPPNADE